MDGVEIGNLAYLGLLLVAVVFWFISNHRQSLGKTMQQALAWGLIFLGVIAAVAMWDDIRSVAIPTEAVLSDEGRIEIPRGAGGHYRVTAMNDGGPQGARQSPCA